MSPIPLKNVCFSAPTRVRSSKIFHPMTSHSTKLHQTETAEFSHDFYVAHLRILLYIISLVSTFFKKQYLQKKSSGHSASRRCTTRARFAARARPCYPLLRIRRPTYLPSPPCLARSGSKPLFVILQMKF